MLIFFRGTYGGCFSTTLGSVCHELGHTFDLGHSKDGIMGRGFDNIDLVFLPLSHYMQHRQRCIQYTTVQLISKLNVECIITTPAATMTSTTITNSLCSSPSSPTLSTSSTSSELINNNKVILQANHNNNINNNSNNIHVTAQSQSSGSFNNGNDDDKTFWSPSCAALLSYHRLVNIFCVIILSSS